ncbi:MAG: N-acetylglucosamine-6-phosphate deacetylase [Caldilineaceae bacterium]
MTANARAHSPLLVRHGLLPCEFVPGTAAAAAEFSAADLAVVDGRIAKVGAALADDTFTQLAATGCYVLPGFIDVHVHGGAGADTMDATSEALETMTQFFAQHGVTAFLPTTITAPHGEIVTALRAVAAYKQEEAPGARILGVHVEGPYISPDYPGAQPATFIRPPDLVEFAELIAAGPLRMITLAPEVAGAARMIGMATQQGIVAVWGHTNATYAECVEAAAAGVTQATHTYNAMSGLHHRNPGVLGATLALDGVYAQLIADNIHVHPAAMKILARCKGAAQTILITDAMRAAGLPDGEYELGGQPVTVKAGACRLANGALAGSILTLDQALVNFMMATGWSLAKAWPVTSRTPARALGLGATLGELAPGYQADIVLLNERLEVEATLVGGKVVYLRDQARLQTED